MKQIPEGAYFTLDTPPVAPLLTTVEAKAHLRMDLADEDSLIDAYVAAINEMLDAEYGELGRALVNQTWKMTLAEFPASGEFGLRFPPVQSITSITYYDADNVQQTLAGSEYSLIAKPDHAYIYRPDGVSWPSTYVRPDAVEVTYACGYGALGSDVPDGILQAARLLLGSWEMNRAGVSDRNISALPLGIRALLNKYRVYSGHI